MKKQRGSSLQKAMAVLLSAVLTAGTVAGAVPAGVYAQEGAETADKSGGGVWKMIH